MKKIISLSLLVLVSGFLVTGCEKPMNNTTNPKKMSENTEKIVTLKTNHGDIKIQLYMDKTPKTAKNFYELAKTGKYDGTIFHRVIPGFMIQGGDYENFDGTGGQSIYGEEFEDEIAEGLSNIRGAVAMANRGPNTNGSQFFIVQKDSQFLDGNYSVFGKVLEGMDVVDEIASVKTGAQDRPVEKVEILKAVVQ